MEHDNTSEIGVADLFRKAQGASGPGANTSSGSRGFVVDDSSTHTGWGRGPIEQDARKYGYDRKRGMALESMSFSASKADRLDAAAAGAILHQIHVAHGISTDNEAKLVAFDNALFWQHVLNGASIMQPGRGLLYVGEMSFDIHIGLKVIGEAQVRRFFRAYADDIAEVTRGVLAAYDPYDYVAIEKHGQLMQVATERGLHKYPEYAFDAADACLNMSIEARRAVMASKAFVLPRVNATDSMPKAAEQSFASAI